MELKDLINTELTTEDSKEKYLQILSNRIDENKKLKGQLLFVMIASIVAFPLLLETKIPELTIGPFKIIDNSVAITIIPTIFAIAFYQYLMVLFDLSKQRDAFKIITSKVLNIDKTSLLNKLVQHFSFSISIGENHLEENSKSLGCIALLLWLPSGIVIMLIPFFFEVYAIIQMSKIINFSSFLDLVFFIIPILFCLFTILLIIQGAKKGITKEISSEKQ